MKESVRSLRKEEKKKLIHEYFLEKLERKITILDPESIERKALAQELVEIRKLVNAHETNMKSLRRHNKKTFAFVALLVFLIFLLYGIYVLIYGY